MQGSQYPKGGVKTETTTKNAKPPRQVHRAILKALRGRKEPIRRTSDSTLAERKIQNKNKEIKITRLSSSQLEEG